MKTLKFNKNSWHFWLATRVAEFDPRFGDFCGYVRAVLFGGLFLSVMAGVGMFLLYAIGREVYALYTCTMTNVCTFGKFEQGFAIFLGCVVGVVAFVALCIWNQNRRDQRRWAIEMGEIPEPKPSFLATAWKSIKEKTCYRVEFQ